MACDHESPVDGAETASDCGDELRGVSCPSWRISCSPTVTNQRQVSLETLTNDFTGCMAVSLDFVFGLPVSEALSCSC